MGRLARFAAALAALAGVVASASGTASAEGLPPDLPTGAIVANVAAGPGARGPAVDESTGRLYVANARGPSVSVIDPMGTLLASIPAPSRIQGWGPGAIATDPLTQRILVADQTGDITVIDSQTNLVTQTVNLGALGIDPSLVVDGGARRIYAVLSSDDRKVVALDADTFEVVASFPSIANPLTVAVDPNERLVFVQNGSYNNVVFIDEDSNQILPDTVANLPDGPWSAVVDSSRHRVYVTPSSAAFVYVIDSSSRRLIETIDVPWGCFPGCAYMAVDEANNMLYHVAQWRLSIIDASTSSIMASWMLPYTPFPQTGMVTDLSRRRLYITSDEKLLVLDTARLLEASQFPTAGGGKSGVSPWISLVGVTLILSGTLLMLAGCLAPADDRPRKEGSGPL